MTKQQLRNRLEEILDTYLMDEGETYCQINLYFEKGQETQSKRLTFGTPYSFGKDPEDNDDLVTNMIRSMSMEGFFINY